eukprot:515779_1
MKHIIYKQNLLIIVDRRYPKDILYAVEDNNSLKLDELYQNYFIGLTFNRSSNNVNKCYLRYDIEQQLRFYPEMLTSIVPRLFVRQKHLNQYEYLSLLFSSDYKHGFCLNLNDEIFNKYYKQITTHEHISVNYNRNHSSYGQNSDISSNCNDEETVSLEQCNSIKYIISCLLSFKNAGCEINSSNESDFDLDHLTGSYDHMVKIHKFCLNAAYRKDIQKYVSNVVGICKSGVKCAVLDKHAFRQREIQQGNLCSHQKNIDVDFIKREILVSTINSLHSYLTHHNDEMYRLRGKINNNNRRFVTETNEIPVYVERKIDESIEIEEEEDDNNEFCVKQIKLLFSDNDKQKMNSTKAAEWCTDNEYDSDALYQDLEDGYLQSNLYEFCGRNNMDNYWDLIETMFIEPNTNKSLNSINFGVSVLQWLRSDEEPKYKNFRDEMLNNQYSTINTELYEQYAMQCAIKIKHSSSKYILNEMLALKFYTDTTEFQSALRRAFWTTSLKKDKRQFYQWAKWLYQASLYHAIPIPRFRKEDNYPCDIFHGLNDIFVVDERSPMYHGPLSTTLAMSVANSFAQNKGLLWTLKCSYIDSYKMVIGIGVDWISQFKAESEILLINQYLPIKTTHNFEENLHNQVDHLLLQLHRYKHTIVHVKLFYQQMGLSFNSQWLNIIRDHPLLFAECVYVKTSVAHRLVNELGINEFSNILIMYESGMTRHLVIKDNKVIMMNTIPQKMRGNIAVGLLRAKYLMVFDDTTVPSTINDDHLYEFRDNVHNIHFVIPFNVTASECRIYVKVDSADSFALVKIIKVRCKKNNGVIKSLNKIEYLLNVLKIWKPQIVNKSEFFNHIGFTVDINDITAIRNCKMLHAKADSTQKYAKKAGIEYTTISHRLLEEFEMTDLQNDFTAYIKLCRDEKQYAFNEELNISHTITIGKWNWEQKKPNGVIQIYCTSNIILNKYAHINASGCGYPNNVINEDDNEDFDDIKSSDDDLLSCLKYGISTSKNQPNAQGGGIIEIISSQNIINYGHIEANGVEGGNGGTISIKCMGKFVNYGTISSLPNGKIWINATCFENLSNTSINSSPIFNLVNHSQQMNTDFTKIINHNIEKIDLEIEKSTSNEHDKYYHPKNLLTESDYKIYRGHYFSNLSASDYIIFTP